MPIPYGFGSGSGKSSSSGTGGRHLGARSKPVQAPAIFPPAKASDQQLHRLPLAITSKVTSHIPAPNPVEDPIESIPVGNSLLALFLMGIAFVILKSGIIISKKISCRCV